METKFDIVDTALAAGNFSTLAAALGAAGLIQTLKGEGPFTVFAPTDDAFAKIPAETLSELLQPENKQKLTAILTYHVVPGRVTSRQVVSLNSAVTVQGQTIKISSDGGVKVNDAKVIVTDVEATNGVIHVIDSVLMPSAAAAV
ncbi:MAG: fasciclin domain-containing protein [Pyrinomonadaceae bacterium]